MAEHLRLSVVTPERAIVDAEADQIQVPGLDGYLGILPGHAPLFSELAVGRLTFTHAGHTQVLAIAGGFVEILDDHVRVLAAIAETAGDIDVDRAQQSRDRATALLRSGGADVDYERLQASARRAATRLEVARKSD